MKPVFDRRGRVVGWLNDNRIVDANTRCRAVIFDGTVIRCAGRYLGRFGGGLFRYKRGDSVVFIEGADGGPRAPATDT